MQYLSKAYSFYSGINPATLSGAIDVIVVRHVDENGEVTLSSSPFHVRFGKLQVLRAAEKKVTLRMPNNLPPPHIAPFNMKVGESGEAFFVLETDEDVPEELLTSPVMSATDMNVLPPTPPLSSDSQESNGHPPHEGDQLHQGSGSAAEHGKTVTQQPFGETEEVVSHDHGSHADAGNRASDLNELADVEPLDLDKPGPVETKSSIDPSKAVDSGNTSAAASPSSILNTASSLLPSIPFLSTPSASKPGTPPPPEAAAKDPDPSHNQQESSDRPSEKQANEQGKPVVSSTDGPENPENPAEAKPGEAAEHLDRDETLSTYKRERVVKQILEPSDDISEIPKVSPGEGEGPDVVYGKDVVLDMSGYHSAGKGTEEHDTAAEKGMEQEAFKVNSALKAAKSLKDSVEISTDAPPRTQITPATRDNLIETFAQDLLAAIPSHSFDPSSSSRPSLPHARSTDPQLSVTRSGSIEDEMADAMSEATVRENGAIDLSDTLNSLSLETANDGTPSKKTPKSKAVSRRRGDRGQSEPPPDMDDDELEDDGLLDPTHHTNHRHLPPSPSVLARSPNGAVYPYSNSQTPRPGTPVNYSKAWDWARVSPHSPEAGGVESLRKGSVDMERSASGPPTQSPVTSQTDPEKRQRVESLPPSASGLDLATAAGQKGNHRDPASSSAGRLKHSDESPYLFVLDMNGGRSYTFEMSLCGSEEFASGSSATEDEMSEFLKQRITFEKFLEDPQIVDDPRLVLRYSLLYLTWSTGYNLLYALAMYRRSLTPSTSFPPAANAATVSSSSGWSRWWRRGQGTPPPDQALNGRPPLPKAPGSNSTAVPTVVKTGASTASESSDDLKPKHFAKTLRLSSDQLKSLNLKPGPNTISFSVTSSYSGLATCTARIFLWEETDQIVISDIDGTITKSDALGHVFAAIGRDWTHLGIAKLYTDIANNGYRVLYLTSRAIGQADSTREYLKSIAQGEYRLPEGPVIMSPDRLMASLHREVIMRKPELFKMACLRDIQRLFGSKAKEAFFAGFGNRITDAMSYRSVGIDTSKIYTIDSTGVVKTELLQAAGHKGSYMGLNDLVNETFPPVRTKVKPEFTDFNYWRATIPDIPLPDLTPEPVSPALSARSASSTTSSRYNVLGRISQTIGRRPSRQPLLPTNSDDAKSILSVTSKTSRPSSPLIGPALSSDEFTSSDDETYGHHNGDRRGNRREGSMPGSFESHTHGEHFPEFMSREQRAEEGRIKGALTDSPRSSEDGRGSNGGRDEDGDGYGDEYDRGDGDSFDDGAIFDDDILAAGEMKNVPF